MQPSLFSKQIKLLMTFTIYQTVIYMRETIHMYTID